MEAVGQDPNISLRQLADHLGIIPSSASRLCDRLVAAGLLSRTPSDSDRRQVTLAPTPDGDQLLADLTRQRRNDLTTVLDKMNATERDQLLRGLTAFASHARIGPA